VLAAVASLFTGVATSAAVTGLASLLLAAWHYRHGNDRPAANRQEANTPS
jgi:hypothetical protein